ncbi:Peptidase C15, pyroglutamyl peptidase I [Senna tora]|uniref:Peptidase C15, pyroglutamyl peptidase I n=1 Tax=Senna tora TaxID=362788 RepID=A0A834TJS5_9FABA|nr:Peptidase C15, pyroglutamyl peptidase I [Senna tora]
MMVLGIQVQLALSLLSIHPLKIRSTTKKTSSSWGIEQVNLTFCKPMCSHEARVIENRGSTSGSTLPRNTTDTLFYGTQIIRLCSLLRAEKNTIWWRAEKRSVFDNVKYQRGNRNEHKFAIERQAVNEATCLSVETITKSLKKRAYDVILSDDAERFVCNYVYYNSLRFAEQHGNKGTLRVLKQEINNKVQGIHENMNSNRKLITLSSQANSDTVSLTEGMLNANMPITVYPGMSTLNERRAGVTSRTTLLHHVDSHQRICFNNDPSMPKISRQLQTMNDTPLFSHKDIARDSHDIFHQNFLVAPL